MPGSIPSSRRNQRLLKLDTNPYPKNITIPRRQISLLAITALLNTLLWSSLIDLTIAIYQIAFDSDDRSNTPSGVLTLVSALATITYSVVHTFFSLKQGGWIFQRAAYTVKKTDYVAIRIVVLLCVLWCLTTGWNMIMIARRPVCLPEDPVLQRWESEISCYISRVGISFATIALVASLILFGMMAVIRRPFEAHLLGHTTRLPIFRASSTQDQFPSGRPSTPSVLTNTYASTLEINISQPPSMCSSPGRHPPNPSVFISPFAPPPLPPPYAEQGLWHQRTASPISITACPSPLPPQPRAEHLLPASAYAPYSIPLSLTASAQRAVHPGSALLPYGATSPHATSHLRGTRLMHVKRSSRSLTSLRKQEPAITSLSPLSAGLSEDSSDEEPRKIGVRRMGHGKVASPPLAVGVREIRGLRSLFLLGENGVESGESKSEVGFGAQEVEGQNAEKGE